MGVSALSDRAAGQVITAAFFQDLKGIICQDYVGRDVNGNPSSGQNLGNSAYPWGAIYGTSLILGGVTLNPSQVEAPAYQIVSGTKRSGSNQPSFILPAGASASFSILATTTNLVINAAGTVGTWATDKTGIAASTAPSSQNTATVNDGAATGQSATRTWGEYGSSILGINSPYYQIAVSSAGSNVTALVGTFQAFKIGSEYFIGYIASSTAITQCLRGFFFDSSQNPIKRSTFSNGATITLMNLGYVFADTDGTTVDTIFVGGGVNNAPSYSFTQPASPSTGDYWYDQLNKKWKRYNGSAFVVVNRVLIGLVVCDSSNCVAARSFDFFGLTRFENTLQIAQFSNTVMKSNGPMQRANVNGNRVAFQDRAVWDTSANLAASTDRYNASVQASTREYFYLADTGETKISDIEPYWRPDLLAWYHPYNPWRVEGWNDTDSSAHFQSSTTGNYGSVDAGQIGDGSVAPIKLAKNYTSSGVQSSSITLTSSWQSLSGLSVTLVCSGKRPVFVGLRPVAQATTTPFDCTFTNTGAFKAMWLRNGNTSFEVFDYGVTTASAFAMGQLWLIDNPPAGSNTYQLQAINNASTLTWNELEAFAIEL